MSLKKMWAKVPKKWQLEIESAFHTFITASLLEASIQYAMHGSAFPTEKGVLLAIGSAILRSGWKATFAFFLSQMKAKE